MQRQQRQPKEVWHQTRERIWQRDRGQCQSPHCQLLPEWSLPLRQAHIDHIQELCLGGTNADHNLRTLCRRCHCLRANSTHRGMTVAALQAGVLPADWRSQVWEG